MLTCACAVLLNAFWTPTHAIALPPQLSQQRQPQPLRQRQQQLPQKQGASVSATSTVQTVERARSSADTEDDFVRSLANAYALVAGGRFAEAAELFGTLVEKRPRDASALYGAALAVFNAGRAAEAEPFAQRAVDVRLAAARAAQGSEARPANANATNVNAANDNAKVANSSAADALVLLAVIQAVRGKDDAALESAKRAVALDPKHFDAQFTLGRALYGAGDDAGAARAFRAANSIRPDDARALFFLATTLERGGDAAGALAAYRELALRKPSTAEGHLGLGVLLVKRGGTEADEGMRELARALEINPDLYEARVTLGRMLVARGRAAESIAHLTRAAELAPSNPEPHYQLSLAYRRLGRKDEAAAEAELVKRIHESRRAGGATRPHTPETPEH
jgi:tetratricopeptide (TPR) repeat protein